MKTVADALDFVRSKIGAAYVWGATGQLCTPSFLEQSRLNYYKSTSSQCPWNDGNNGYSYKERCKHWLLKSEGGQQDKRLESFDCGGLAFDSFLGINTTASGYYSSAKVRGAIGSIPARAGLQVFKKNDAGAIVHVGCYMNDGTVIEAKNTASGVVRTTFAGAGWDLWAECYLLDYAGGEDMVLQLDCPKGQAVYNYQLICKRLGGAVGAFKDMVLKDASGNALLTGCDGSYGPTMVKVTNAFCVKFGLPQTTLGTVTDVLVGKMQEALMSLETGIPQEQYDSLLYENTQLVTENGTLTTENQQLKNANGELVAQNGQLVKDVEKANGEVALVTVDRNKKVVELEDAANNIRDLIVLSETYKN